MATNNYAFLLDGHTSTDIATGVNTKDNNYGIMPLSYHAGSYDKYTDDTHSETTYHDYSSGDYYKDWGPGYYNDHYGDSYSCYSDYGCYSDYSCYSAYNKTNIYFYWTDANGNILATNTTGLMKNYVTAAKANTLINLINTYAGRSIATVAATNILTASKFNEMANALGAATVAAGTKITPEHFVRLQTAFNGKGYYKNG